MAVVDANYKLMWYDVGGVGHQLHAQIYNASTLKASIVAGSSTQINVILVIYL